MKLVLVILISYLFGSVPWALVIGKVFYHKDIRKEGSGNPGATNAPGTEIYAGLACCIGHCFPLFAGFKGGKAVATSYGFLLGIAVLITHEYIWNFFLPVFCFFCFLFSTKMVSVSSMCSLLIETATSFILASMGRIEWNIPIALLILWVFVTYRHRENIVRIKNGTENKIGRKKE